MPLHLLALGLALVGPTATAIERSVHERLGDVRVKVLELTGPRVPILDPQAPPSAVLALPEPGARLGRPMRFVIVADGMRVGSVVAILEVSGPVVRASRALARQEQVESEGVEVVDQELTGLLLRRLPTLEDVVGTRARRDIASGEVLTDAVLVVPPTVTSGDEVLVSVTAGPVEVTGPGRASGSGRVGDVIRVLVPSSRKPLKARITGPGSVEIVR